MSQPRHLNWNSRTITRGWQRGANAFYFGLGFSDADLDKPQVGIGVPLNDGNLCNVHAYDLAQRIASGCREAGLVGFPFGTPAVSDNLTQGLEGGNASLPSRNAIANAAEMVASAHCHDALVGLHHCDKNGPGFAMALARLDYPGLIVSGGSILPGCLDGQQLTIQSPYDAQARAATGEVSEAEVDRLVRHACPGPGGCGIAASFNTWAIAMEAIGLMLPGSASNPAVSEEKKAECARVGAAVRHLLELDLRPRQILTRRAFANAVAAIAASGGSTNGLLHLLALAQEARVDFSLTDIQEILRKTPVLCDFAPRGHGTMVDLHTIGGTPVLLRHLVDAGVLDGGCLTVTGRTLAENVADASPPPAGSLLVAPAATPFRPFADIQVAFGNLAPDGIVFKLSAAAPTRFSGPALCFGDARAVQDAVAAGTVRPGHVVVLRGLGPVASGMPEVLIATAALAVPALKGRVAIISDTRVSGVSHGLIGVHCAPEAAVGGPLAAVREGDTVSFDALAGTVDLHVPAGEIQRRLAEAPQADSSKHPRTYLADFAATTTQANLGCVSRAVAGRAGER
jgi:dihydroxy-acid dehydratase